MKFVSKQQRSSIQAKEPASTINNNEEEQEE